MKNKDSFKNRFTLLSFALITAMTSLALFFGYYFGHATAQSQLLLLISLLPINAAVSIWSSRKLSKILSSKTHELAKLITTLKNKNYGQIIDNNVQDEFFEILDAVNHMSIALKDNESELLKVHKEIAEKSTLAIMAEVSDEIIQELTPIHQVLKEQSSTNLVIQKNLVSLEKTIQKLEQFTHHKGRLNFEKFSLHELVNDTLEKCQSDLENNNVELSYQFACDDPTLFGDKDLIEQVVFYIVSLTINEQVSAQKKWIKINCGHNNKFVELAFHTPISSETLNMNSSILDNNHKLEIGLSNIIMKEHGGMILAEKDQDSNKLLLRFPIDLEFQKTNNLAA